MAGSVTIPSWVVEAGKLIETARLIFCREGHQFVVLDDHPGIGAEFSCPHCMQEEIRRLKIKNSLHKSVMSSNGRLVEDDGHARKLVREFFATSVDLDDEPMHNDLPLIHTSTERLNLLEERMKRIEAIIKAWTGGK